MRSLEDRKIGNEEGDEVVEQSSYKDAALMAILFEIFKGPDNSFFENLLMEEPVFKIGRYNPEERQERISKYRAKRNQRNFNKTIK
ncbi:hypothetical protein Goshw_022337, partial [Gossypium schwendimanii]|nr:hypothetical protein [Gossypium schwendimanii]